MDAGALSESPISSPYALTAPAIAESKSAKGSSNTGRTFLLVGGLGLAVISVGVLSLYAAGKIPSGYKLPTIICGSIGVIGGVSLAVIGGFRIYRSGKKDNLTETEEGSKSATQAEFDRCESLHSGQPPKYWEIIFEIRRGEQQNAIDYVKKYNVNVNQPFYLKNTTERYSLLHFASYMRMDILILELLERGADPNLKDAAGETAKDLYAANDGTTSLCKTIPKFILEGKRLPAAECSPFEVRKA